MILLTLFIALSASSAPDAMTVTDVTPNVTVFGTATGNVVALVGPDGALLIGTPSAASTPQISKWLNEHTESTVRYVVVGPQDTAHSQGDAGWGKQGAFVAMHEKALDRLGGHSMGGTSGLPPHLTELGVDRPRISFSEVLTFDMDGDAVHIIHQPPAYSDADSVVHFHAAHLIYLGDVFPGDGYPEIDAAQGGKLDGVLEMLKAWTSPNFRVVPARGKVGTGADVKALHGLIVTVRDRVKTLVDAGKTEDEVVAAHPSAEFDEKWGTGRIKPDVFVRQVYRGVKTP